MDVADLPVLDIVVLSHLHGDHFDRIAKRGLDRAVPVVSTRHAARRLRARGFRNATALGTWTTETLSRPDGSRLRITALPGRHAPGLVQALFPPVMGSLLEFEPAAGAPSLRLYVTGDTLLHDGIAEIARRYPAPDLALVHLGGTRILGVLLTMDAAQGLRLVQAVRPRVTLPIHYATTRCSDPRCRTSARSPTSGCRPAPCTTSSGAGLPTANRDPRAGLMTRVSPQPRRYTLTCWRLSAVNGERRQSAHRATGRRPASSAMRSSSAGHA